MSVLAHLAHWTAFLPVILLVAAMLISMWWDRVRGRRLDGSGPANKEQIPTS